MTYHPRMKPYPAPAHQTGATYRNDRAARRCPTCGMKLAKSFFTKGSAECSLCQQERRVEAGRITLRQIQARKAER